MFPYEISPAGFFQSPTLRRKRWFDRLSRTGKEAQPFVLSETPDSWSQSLSEDPSAYFEKALSA